MRPRILGMLALGLLCVPVDGDAETITVWDTFPHSTATGMIVGEYYPPEIAEHGILFTPSAGGYFDSFSLVASQVSGTAAWTFNLRSDSSGTPGSVLETISGISVSGGPTQYDVAAGGTVLLSAGESYWLTALLPSGSSGIWWKRSSGTGTRALTTNGAFWSVYVDGVQGAAQIRVTTAIDPAVAIGELIASVEVCVAEGELKASHGRALANKLESALKKLEKDDTVAVVDKLQEFIDQVTELEADGQIGTDKANALSADAQAILDAVQGPGKTSPTALRPAAEESTWSGMKSLYR